MNTIGHDWTKLDIESPITVAPSLDGDTSVNFFIYLGFDNPVQSVADSPNKPTMARPEAYDLKDAEKRDLIAMIQAGIPLSRVRP